MNFAQPQFLWMLLLVLPLLAAFFFWSWRVKQKLIAQFVQSRLLSTLTIGVSPARQKLRIALLMVAVTAVFVALAGPQLGFTWEEASQRGLDIVVVMDTSRSMLAKDVIPNRLEKAKLAAFDLMRQAREDRLGLVPFAGNAFLQCPLTLDEQAFRQSLDAVSVGIIPQGGTAISQAIRSAQSAFEKNNNNHKVIVLFTDGEDHDSDAETLGAAKEASEAGINIFTVGVGTPAGEFIQVTDDKGNTSLVKDDDGNVIKSHLNETLLRQIASDTGGFYLPLVGADPMGVLYQRGLEPLPKSTSTTKLTRVFHERYHWPLTFAIVCLLFEFLLPDRARSRHAEKAIAANPALPAAVALLCFLLISPRASASTPGAYDKYQSGDYQAAFDEYSRLAGLKTNDYRLQYDAGTAAYRAKKLDAAEKELDAALKSPGIISDLNTQERAYFNLGNTQYHQGEPATEPQKKQERWEQSISNYSKALQLNANDLDARNNLAFVKRKLEELKQQQQQQQQQKNQNNQDQKDQKDQKQQQQQDQQKQDQKKQDQKDQQQQQAQQNQQQNGGQGQQQQSQDQKSDQQKQQEEAQKQEQQQQQQQAQQAQQNQPTNSGQATAAGDDQRDKTGDQNQQVAVAGQMTQQEAKQMLDSQKDDEQTLIFSPENKPVQPLAGKIKDW